jgi:ABC-type thiamin/hydroxymethylpyrimidine transport system permease subunit
MMIKSVLLFLLVMVVIAMIGNALMPGVINRQIKKRLAIKKLGVAKPLVCPRCKRYEIGSGGCHCK